MSQFNKIDLYGIGVACSSFLVPIQGMLITVLATVLIDTAFAIYMTVKLGGWQSYKSNKLFNIAPKLFFYLGGICLAFCIDNFIVAGPLWDVNLLVSKVVSAFFIYIEIKSLDETSMKLGNKSFWVIIKELIGKANSVKKDLSDDNK